MKHLYDIYTCLKAQLIKNYENEIEALTNDVKNIDAIRRALPEGCWKRTHLEVR